MSKATLYLNDGIHKALRMKAAETSRSMSDLVNDALESTLLDDLEDIEVWRERRNEPRVGFEKFVQQLKNDGVLQR
ncbi:MAG: CopG family transcriptional regulator [Verrucomicrobia bacterium]|nr:CopG family transcriptional regulator [Verrucomicrobiota bacterium]MCH8511378.1 CopG family transcriptional regulator [Kiritimatiellia bacterium]